MIVERIVKLHIQKLPEGFYLATSDNIQGLVAQGRTITETIEMAKDIAKKLIEAQEEQISKLAIVTPMVEVRLLASQVQNFKQILSKHPIISMPPPIE
jgi:predicted RNase H-like HicB family nuclease